MAMISIMPSPTDKMPVPKPIMINPTMVQVIENADFLPDAKDSPKNAGPVAPAAEGSENLELHQSAPAPVVRTKVTMHSGLTFFVPGTVAETAALVG